MSTKGFTKKISLARHLYLTWWTLHLRRQYVIDKINKPLVKAITIIAMRYPEPTKDHTSMPNTHRLLDIEDEFFKHENNISRDLFLRAVWRILIVKYDTDRWYRQRVDWVIEQIKKRGWEPDPMGHPKNNWNE